MLAKAAINKMNAIKIDLSWPSRARPRGGNSASGPIEPWTTQGRMMVAFNGVMAANEIETIRSRMQGGKEAKRREGKHPGNDENLPFGERLVQGVQTLDLLARTGGVTTARSTERPCEGVDGFGLRKTLRFGAS